MSLIPCMSDVAAEAAAIPKIRPRENGGSRTASDFEVNLQVDNLLKLRPGSYFLRVGWHRFASNGDVIRNIECKLIVDCTPCAEVSEDEGPFPIIGLTEEEQPVIVSWSILLNSHEGIEMTCGVEKARLAWMAGGSILFYDNMRDGRCTVAACVFLRDVTYRQCELWW